MRSAVFLFAFLLVVSATHGDPTFVIVGAGTAGSILAGRLCTSLPRATIVMLERARPRTAEEEFLVRAPRLSVVHQVPNSLNEAFTSTPNAGLGGRRVVVTTGRTLGGSSAINGMQWSEPAPYTVPFFRVRGLTARVARRMYDRAFRKLGVAPPPPALRQMYADNYTLGALAAGIRLWPRRYSPLVGDQIWDINLGATQQGTRRDTYTSYVAPVIDTACKGRLTLVQSADVKRLLYRTGKWGRREVRGVEYLDVQNKTVSLYAQEEVLVAAGGFGSPMLLERSGIGRPDVLRSAGVQPVHNLPVGERVQGRPTAGVLSSYEGGDPPVPLSRGNNESLWLAPAEVARWRAGLPAIPGQSSTFTLGQIGTLGYFTAGFLGVPNVGLGQKVFRSLCLLTPRSFGTFHITADPDSPRLELNLAGRRSERRRLARCVARLRTIHDAMRDQGFPVTLLDDPDVDAVVRDSGSTARHFVGGCAVGRVVTRDLRVRGLAGVRVIDSSVLRHIPRNAGPYGTTCMLAEFAAEKLHDKYARKYADGKRLHGARAPWR